MESGTVLKCPEATARGLFARAIQTFLEEGVVDDHRVLTDLGRAIKAGLLHLESIESDWLLAIGGHPNMRFVVITYLDGITRLRRDPWLVKFNEPAIREIMQDEHMPSPTKTLYIKRFRETGVEHGYLIKETDGTLYVNPALVNAIYKFKEAFLASYKAPPVEGINLEEILDAIPQTWRTELDKALLTDEAGQLIDSMPKGDMPDKEKHKAGIASFSKEMLVDIDGGVIEFLLYSRCSGDATNVTLVVPSPMNKFMMLLTFKDQGIIFPELFKGVSAQTMEFMIVERGLDVTGTENVSVLINGRHLTLGNDSIIPGVATFIEYFFGTVLKDPELFLFIKGTRKSIIITQLKNLFSSKLATLEAFENKTVVCVTDIKLTRRSSPPLAALKDRADSIMLILEQKYRKWNRDSSE